MKYFSILLFSFLIGTLSAQNKTETSKIKEAPTNCAVKVSFGSPGSGIDIKKYNEIKALIEEKKLKYSERPIGREGEMEICLPLKELKRTKKKQFIAQLKKTAEGGQSVTVSDK